MESLTIMKFQEEESTGGTMEKSMKENGSRIKCMEEENLHGKMERCTKEILGTTSDTE